jgi:ribosomal-protein-alanine N-acetyltransferase
MNEKLLIRQWKKEDAASLTAIANNKNVWLNLRDAFPHPYTLGDAFAWIEHTSKAKPIENFAIEYNGSIAGSIGVVPRADVYRKTIEIGYFIGEKYWGKGIATKAVSLLLDYIKQHFSVVRIYAEVFEHNKSSMKVLEHNGFHLESIRKKAVIKNNAILDDYVWVKLL